MMNNISIKGPYTGEDIEEKRCNGFFHRVIPNDAEDMDARYEVWNDLWSEAADVYDIDDNPYNYSISYGWQTHETIDCIMNSTIFTPALIRRFHSMLVGEAKDMSFTIHLYNTDGSDYLGFAILAQSVLHYDEAFIALEQWEEITKAFPQLEAGEK